MTFYDSSPPLYRWSFYFFPSITFVGLVRKKLFSIWKWKCFLLRWWPSIYSSWQQKARIIIIFSCSNEFTTYDDVLSFFYPFFPTILTGQHITELLSQNTTTGMFRKLGRFYESCLRQELNSSSIRLKIEELGGYIPISLAGPSSVTTLLKKMMEMGAPLVLFDIYYDLSYGKKPQSLLIVDIPTDVHQILQVSWNGWRRVAAIPTAAISISNLQFNFHFTPQFTMKLSFNWVCPININSRCILWLLITWEGWNQKLTIAPTSLVNWKMS